MTRRTALGVAVIGTGRMGADHVRRLDEVTGGARVAAVVDLDAERAGKLAAGIDGCTAYTDPAAAMAADDVDAVLIASPGPAHEAALLTAFEHDLPVLCSPPPPARRSGDIHIRTGAHARRAGRRRCDPTEPTEPTELNGLNGPLIVRSLFRARASG